MSWAQGPRLCTAFVVAHDRRARAWDQDHHLPEAVVMRMSTVARGWEQSRPRTVGRAGPVAALVSGLGLELSLRKIVVEARD